MDTTAKWAAAIATLACASSVQAHHSGSMYEQTPVWVSGTVVRFENVNPHTVITLEDRSADGRVRLWAVEGPGQSQLERLGIATDVPNIGDTLKFCAFAYKSPAELSRSFPGVDFSVRRASRKDDGSSPQFVAGHVMVMPDGEKQLWEPHGVLSECIRSSDEQRQYWLDFLNSNPRARQSWCEQKGFKVIQGSAPLRQFVEEIDSSIYDPCQ